MTPTELAEIALAVDAHERATIDQLTFREFLESDQFCSLSLSPMVAAIADASQGIRPDTIDDDRCLRYFGCTLDELPRRARRVIALHAGGRGGKTSRLLSTYALYAAVTVPLPTLSDGEHAASLIISSELVFARQALSFCGGYVAQSPKLRPMLVGEPGTDSLTLLRPDGNLVDVRVRAAGAKGKGGRAFTLTAALFDEAAFFYDSTGVVNDVEAYRAVIQRIVPGGQLWMVSTPWVEGIGKLEEVLATNWGSHERALAIRGVGTKVLNPTWDPDGEIEAELRRDDPENAEREIDAKPLTAGTLHFLSREAIDAAFRPNQPQVIPYRVGCQYAAGGDTGFKKNSSALAIVEKLPGEGEDDPERYRLVRREERKPLPGVPLQPDDVVGDFADVMAGYGVLDLVVDSHEIDDVTNALAAKGATASNAPLPAVAFVAFRNVLHAGRLDLPEDPRLRQQMRDVLSRPMPGGGTQIVLPKRPDGSHGDLLVAVVRAVWKAMQVESDMTIYRVKRRR